MLNLGLKKNILSLLLLLLTLCEYGPEPSASKNFKQQNNHF